MGAVLLVTVLGGAAFYEQGTERLAIRQRSEQALELLERARGEEQRGETETATQTLHEAYLLAQGAYTDYPKQPKVREAFLEVLRARADFAEQAQSWTLAEAMGLELPGLQLAKRLYDRVAAEGWEDFGTQALLKLYEEEKVG